MTVSSAVPLLFLIITSAVHGLDGLYQVLLRLRLSLKSTNIGTADFLLLSLRGFQT
jgi:hypothetical protein